MTAISPRQIRLLHVARNKLRLSDAEYRTTLAHIAGVTSSSNLDRAGFEAVLAYFEHIGFRPLVKTGPDYGNRPGMASFAQCELIRALWQEWSGAPVEGGLNTWLKRCFKVDSLRFLSAEDARKAITALKSMKARAA